MSRRMSEVLGVVLFAASLLWLISLASYSPADPAWFFNTGTSAPTNFAGRLGAFLAELSFQLFGHASFVIPVVMVVVGWHYFWCRALDAVYTKALGAVLLVACLSSFLALAFETLDFGGRVDQAGGVVGALLAGQLAEYLNRTGSIILILTLLFLAVILATQVSLGRLFAGIAAGTRERARATWNRC